MSEAGREKVFIFYSSIYIIVSLLSYIRCLPAYPYPGWEGQIHGDMLAIFHFGDATHEMQGPADYGIPFPTNQAARDFLQEGNYWKVDGTTLNVEPKFTIVDQVNESGVYKYSRLKADISISVPINVNTGMHEITITLFDETTSEILKIMGEIFIYQSKNRAQLSMVIRIISPWVFSLIFITGGWLLEKTGRDWGVLAFWLGILIGVITYCLWTFKFTSC